MLLFSDVLYMLVRYASPSGPMCLRCLMLTLSGPVELLFLLCFIAAWTCVVVSVMLVICSLSVMLVICSLSVFLSMCLFVLCVLCLTVLVNCLLNAFAICVGEVTVFSLNVIVLFLGSVCVLLVFCWLIRVLSSKECSKKTQPARGWNATDICTNCVNTTLPPEMAARFRQSDLQIVANLSLQEESVLLELYGLS